jgi:hypothetical protein
MRARFILWFGLAALSALQLGAGPALAAGGGKGNAEEQVVCLNRAVGALEAKVEALSKMLESKANDADALKWNDRVALRNEDMRIFPRCLDNPGPNSTNLTDVFANSCAKVPAQTWMIAKPYH